MILPSQTASSMRIGQFMGWSTHKCCSKPCRYMLL